MLAGGYEVELLGGGGGVAGEGGDGLGVVLGWWVDDW